MRSWLILLILCATQVKAQVAGGITNGLVAYYTFEDGAVKDRAGTNNGALVNAPTFTQGRIGNAGSFNGTTQYVNLGSDPMFVFSNITFTISAWVNTTASVNEAILANDGTQGGWVLYMNGPINGLIKNSTANNVCFNSTTATGFNDGRWHNVVAEFTTDTSVSTNNNIVFYVDATPRPGSKTNLGVYDNVSPRILIASRTNSSLLFLGKIDDVRIYNRGLSQSEISQNYALKPPGVQ